MLGINNILSQALHFILKCLFIVLTFFASHGFNKASIDCKMILLWMWAFMPHYTNLIYIII